MEFFIKKPVANVAQASAKTRSKTKKKFGRIRAGIIQYVLPKHPENHANSLYSGKSMA